MSPTAVMTIEAKLSISQLFPAPSSGLRRCHGLVKEIQFLALQRQSTACKVEDKPDSRTRKRQE